MFIDLFLQMCMWFMVAVYTRICWSLSNPITLEFDDYKAKNILTKDLFREGRAIPFIEVDYFPFEPNPENSRNTCKDQLKKGYQDFVYALAEYNSCDINHISGTSLEVLDGQLFSVASSIKFNQPPYNLTTEQKELCSQAKISAYCPTYLQYAECVFFAYVNSEATKILTSPNLQLSDTAIHPLFPKYVGRDTKPYSFLLDETVSHLCRFVNTACGTLHPQFEDTGAFRLQHICTVFDVYTPLQGLDSLYDETLPEKERADLILRERLLAETYYFNMKNDGTKFSPLGLPYDVHLNPGDVLTKFFVELCKRRCSYHNIMRDLTHAWKKLSVLGYQRQVLMCAKLSTTCSECPVCSDMAIAVKST